MDRGKVIKGLTLCTHHDGTDCPSCPYFDEGCVDNLCADALELLKEQEEILKSILREKNNELNSKTTALQIEIQNREVRKVGEMIKRLKGSFSL